MPDENVLIVEDEELMRAILRELCEGAGYDVFTADGAETAIEVFSANEIALTLTDIKMAGRDGLALLDQIKSIDPDAMVIIMTAYSTVDTAVAALRKGAYDYVTKPFVNEDLLQTVRNALAYRSLFRENRFLRRELREQYELGAIIGTSDALQKVLDLVKKVAGTSSNVLIEGESGTGKELIARAIHFNSSRSDKPFLAINCGALPESLLESELFGHVKGAFTGAVANHSGFFRSAAGGTLLLDEIGEMPRSLQVKLLRALQEHEVIPVGASKAVKFDARIIATTNKRLADEVAARRFREDLFYRLNVVEIEVPPLRERRDDIPLLAKHFVSTAAHSQGRGEKRISTDAMLTLKNFSWPGNVRELEHIIERAFILGGDEIGVDDLPEKLRSPSGVSATPHNGRPTLAEMEHRYITKTLDEAAGDKIEAARILDIDLSTLYRKLKRYEQR